ncbi:MFS transporter [Clostridium sediminicola]|uniref:MFS transporter n=1 Tax=Clostridium sediminicola TaxID=3114879 RepID=UPI0031F24FBA
MSERNNECKKDTIFTGMGSFPILWIGQLISRFGSRMTLFSVMVWLVKKEGIASPVAIYTLFATLPVILLSPIAGAITDRYNKKYIMIISDIIAVLPTIILLFLFASNKVELIHIYIMAIINGTCSTFQEPAFTTSIPTLVSKDKYLKANSMQSIANSFANIFAPLLAPFLLILIGKTGIFIIDILTFLIAVSLLLFIHMPAIISNKSRESKRKKSSILSESVDGFRYIYKNKVLLILISSILIINFFMTLGGILLIPMIMAKTSNNEMILGIVEGLGSVGALFSGFLLMGWKGPKNPWFSIFFPVTLLGFSFILMAVTKVSATWAIANFGIYFCAITASSFNRKFLHTNVPMNMQGRVFAIGGMLSRGITPVAMLLSGILADKVFEPLMAENSSFSNIFGGLVGTEYGSGMGLLFLISGIFLSLVAVSAYYYGMANNVVKNEDVVAEN